MSNPTNNTTFFRSISGPSRWIGTKSSSSQGSRRKPAARPAQTKDQIVAMYGKTDNVQVSSEGETWMYHLNMGEAFIPFNFGYRPKIRIINFDKDGKVAHWSYSK